MDFESTAVETTEAVTGEEVAEPLTEETQMEGSNESDFADQTSETVANEPQDSSTNRAFQEMRHRNRELEEEIENLRLEAQARAEAFSRVAGEDADEISVLAEMTGMSEDEVLEQFASAKESYEKDAKIKSLEEELDKIAVEKAMNEDLSAIRKLDPKIKSLSELGDTFTEYIKAGLSAENAYWACKAREDAYKAKPAPEVGTVSKAPPEKDYYTQAEIDAMSSEELSKNWQKILNSWGR